MKGSRSRIIVWREAVCASGLDRTAKLVALVLSVFMNATTCRDQRAIETIAGAASLSERAVQHALRRVEAAGFLFVEWSKGGPKKTNRYLAILPATANALHRSEWDNGEREAHKGERDAHNGERRSGELVLGTSTRRAHIDVRAASLIRETCIRCRKPFTGGADDVFCPDCLRASAEVAA
jgi:DNA-binding PadR family transcriptional regulator